MSTKIGHSVAVKDNSMLNVTVFLVNSLVGISAEAIIGESSSVSITERSDRSGCPQGHDHDVNGRAKTRTAVV